MFSLLEINSLVQVGAEYGLEHTGISIVPTQKFWDVDVESQQWKSAAPIPCREQLCRDFLNLSMEKVLVAVVCLVDLQQLWTSRQPPDAE